METMRKPFQGVLNIIRFNWHFFVIALGLVLLLLLAASRLDSITLSAIAFAILISISLSLLVSFYVYDLSGLYNLDWISSNGDEKLLVNINAGFDETSVLLKAKFNASALVVLDFYNPKTHTEISIKRARKAYPSFPDTKQIDTNSLNLESETADKIFVIFAAHEIRNPAEKTAFFVELNRILKPNGTVYITEHLRDIPNFIAYTVGFFHFYGKASWLKLFKKTNFTLQQEQKLTPFVSNFILTKNGTTL